MTWSYSRVTLGSLGVTLESLGVILGVGESSGKSSRHCKVRGKESFNKSEILTYILGILAQTIGLGKNVKFFHKKSVISILLKHLRISRNGKKWNKKIMQPLTSIKFDLFSLLIALKNKENNS